MKRFAAIGGCIVLLIINTSFNQKRTATVSYYIIIDKAKYELTVVDGEGWLVTYPVVFGNDDLADKMMDGDRETPEGLFTLISKSVHEKWDRMLMIDYPTYADSIKFIERKQQGLIPNNVSMGRGIGIHGVARNEDYKVDQYQNWTDGCISMKNEDVEELYDLVPVGTKVFIRK